MTGRVVAESGRFRSRVAEVSRPRYRASFTLYVDNPAGGAWCIPIECDHEHADRDAASTCAARLARYVERHEAVPAWARESYPGCLAAALALASDTR